MKVRIFGLITVCLMYSCKQEEPISIEEIDSNEIVTITYNEKKTDSKDSVDIHFPREFKIRMNSTDISDFKIYYVIDKKVLMNIIEYEVLDKMTKKNIIAFGSYISNKENFNIIIKERNHLISKKQANQLLLKYNINQKLEGLKFGDTVKLVPYNRFRTENTVIIASLRKVEDSIFFRVTSNKGEAFVKGEKINW